MRRPLLISYDMSYSGAPAALLALAQALKRLGEHPLVVALYGGPLGQHFLDSGIELAQKVDPANVSFVVANTALCVPEALRFKRYGIPVAAWLHESAHFFETLAITVNLSPQACRLDDLDVVLVPARFQVHDLARLLPPGKSYQLRNLVRQESFRPPGGDGTLAVCGQWELRKGQRQLIELAHQAGLDCRFKFIGPTRPQAAGLDDAMASRHRFLGSLDPQSAKLEIATSDGVVSCALAEVQPLSVIEALMAGRPVLLSDIEAHRVLAHLIPNAFLFDRASRQSFAEGYRKLRGAVPDAEAARRAREAASTLFGESAFDRRLHDILEVLHKDKGAAANVAFFQDA